MLEKIAPKSVEYTDPPFVTRFFGSPRWAWLWLIARIYIGYTWLIAGLEKLQSPGWMQGGEALKGFWGYAIKSASGEHPAIGYKWYVSFLQMLLDSGSYTWFAKLVAVGEFLVGVALILGLFTGIAAFFGGLLNWNFMMAGTAGVNPFMFVIAVLLILAWKTAGWFGLDRWVLSALGTPWRPGKLFTKKV